MSLAPTSAYLIDPQMDADLADGDNANVGRMS
jgi:hypothetical protein